MFEFLDFFVGVIELLINTGNSLPSLFAGDPGGAWAFRQVAKDVWVAYQSAGSVVRLLIPSGVAVTSGLLVRFLFKKLRGK